MNRITIDGMTFEYNSIGELPDWVIDAMYDEPEIRESKGGNRHDMLVHGKNMKRIENDREHREV